MWQQCKWNDICVIDCCSDIVVPRSSISKSEDTKDDESEDDVFYDTEDDPDDDSDEDGNDSSS